MTKGKANYLAVNTATIIAPKPGLSNVSKPDLSYIRTNNGEIPPEKIYYQLQDVDHNESIQIDGKDFVIPAGTALVYRDKKILPLKVDNDLKYKNQAKEKSKATTLIALKGDGTNEVLTVLPCAGVVETIVGKSRSRAVNNTFKGVTYFDGDEYETVDIKWVKYQAEHGDIGMVSVLGTKILMRRYLVLPLYEGVRGKSLTDFKKESAKHVS